MYIYTHTYMYYRIAVHSGRKNIYQNIKKQMFRLSQSTSMRYRKTILLEFLCSNDFARILGVCARVYASVRVYAGKCSVGVGTSI